MQIENGGALTPEAVEIVATAFQRSWNFVERDAKLADRDPDELRAALARQLLNLAEGGEKNPSRLANGAIAALRNSAGQIPERTNIISLNAVRVLPRMSRR